MATGATAGAVLPANQQSYTLGGTSNVENLLYNGAVNMTLVGNGLDNFLRAGSGNNSLSGNTNAGSVTSTEADTLVGGVGNDTYFVDSDNDRVVELSGEGVDTIRTSLASYALGTAKSLNVENLTTTLATGASLLGSSVANSITGGNGNDTLEGGVNTDATVGDTLSGGLGDDWYILNSGLDSVIDSGGIDTLELRYNVSAYNLTWGFDNLVYNGTTAASLYVGNFGLNNYMRGSVGADTFNGTGGNDTFEGGAGNDIYFIDSTTDVIIEAAGSAAGTSDTIWTSLTVLDMNNYSNVESLYRVWDAAGQQGGNITATGNSLNNTIVGGVFANSLSGGAGNNSLLGASNADTLDGGTGADTMQGEGGNDVYIVDSAADIVRESLGVTPSAWGSDTIQVYGSAGFNTFSLNNSRWSAVENLTFFGAGGQTTTQGFAGSGNFASNVITGSNGNDTLTMSIGYTDTLVGNDGDDLLQIVNGDTYFARNNGASIAGSATGFASSLGEGFSPITLGATFAVTGSSAPSVGINNVKLTWLSGVLSFALADGKTYSWTTGLDSAQHTFAVSYSGSGTPAAYMDGVDLGASRFVQGAAQTLGSAGTLTIANPAAFWNEAIDNVRVYNSALSAADLRTITGTPTDSTTAGANLKGLYLFNGNYANSATSPDDAGGTLGNISNASLQSAGVGSLSGGAGNDRLVGNAQNDTLDGGDGADTMNGGAGHDIYYVDSLSDRVIDSAGSDTILISNRLLTFNLATNGVAGAGVIESLGVDTRPGMSSSSDNFIITGNSTTGTILFGGAGADTLLGMNGNDTFYGDFLQANQVGKTVDSLDGGGGSDYYSIAFYGTGDIDSGSDQVFDSGGSTTDSDGVNISGNTGTSIFIDLTSNFGGTIETLYLNAFTVGNTIYGNGARNNLFGGTGADYINGGLGDDWLQDQNNPGGTSADTLVGGDGNDSYGIFNANTRIVENANEGTDRIFVHSSIASYDLSIPSLVNVEEVWRNGTSGAATFTGNALNNLLAGSNSNDWLSGGGRQRHPERLSRRRHAVRWKR